MKNRILVVEDDHYFALRLAETLEDRDFEVDVVDSVQAALAVNLDNFDGIVSDIMLPNDPEISNVSDTDTRSGFYAGVALLRLFRKRGSRLPMLLCSGLGNSSDAAEWASKEGIPFVNKYEGSSTILSALEHLGLPGRRMAPRAFIVHGKDDCAVLELKDFLENTLKWEPPIILRDQPSRGKTIIEKFEELSGRVDCVFVLLTPDDTGVNLSTDDDKRRARQNVIFELGFFYSKLGRKSGRVVALKKGPIDLPSDIQGIIWIDISKGIKAVEDEIRNEVSEIYR